MIISLNTCRLCLILVDKENHVSLFSSDVSGSLPKMIMDITDIQVNEADGLPSIVCPSCFAQLELSHQFKLQVEKADKILREEISINALLPGEDESAECEMENKVIELHTDSVLKQDEAGGTLNEITEGNTGHASEPEQKGEAGVTLNEIAEGNTGQASESEQKVSQDKEFSNKVNTCDSSTKEETKYLKQKVKTTNDTVKVYKCEICNESYKLKHLLHLHRKVHKEGHKCDTCGKVFSNKLYLESHRRIHSDERPFLCKQCEKSFKMEIGLKIHIRNVHNNSGPLSCALCGKAYKTKSGLQFHKRTQHIKNGPSFMCEICGKTFMECAALCSHRVVHANKPVSCEVCNKTYPHPRALRKHKTYVHQVSNRFCCSVCGKYYKHARILKIHKASHSGQKPHVCSICGLRFTQKCAVRTHMKVHTGLEPYDCKHCGQSFKWKQTFDKHVLKCLKKQRISNSKITVGLDTTRNPDVITENANSS